MGINIFKRNSDKKTIENYQQLKLNDFDPNPGIFKIIKHFQYNEHLLILINYPNCVNYEGNKILLFRNVKYECITKLKEIDPHFTNDNSISPLARFEPTDYGWGLGLKLLEIM